MMGRDGGDDISEVVEEEVCMTIEYWRTLVMSCSWGVLVLSVQDCLDYRPLLDTHAQGVQKVSDARERVTHRHSEKHRNKNPDRK
ncbi:MAG: hypothetical protein DRO73_05765 [Candidatus Thorarchaeota archaeon]|nr:MAG: hypothetical protein DRO73_05765 [Candidatus Thorarchaeota archaeon]